MKQDNFSRYMLTDFYYLQEKIREMREMIFCDDLDEVFDRVPSGTKTRNDMVKNLDDARQCLAKAHLAWLSTSKRHREVENVSA